MSLYKRLVVLIIMTLATTSVPAQKIIKGKIIDSLTSEPLAGATIQCSDACGCSCTSAAGGEFEIHCKGCSTLNISVLGYGRKQLPVSEIPSLIVLAPSSSFMHEVVVTASRGERIRKADAPVAISSISAKTIQETRATTLDQLLNKISGVNMVNLGNEQHQMSIRQPMTTKSLFLYLEDGIPVRTTGLFNHNALLEMNMAAVRSIEVIKGPSSSLYGSEAVGGVVNLITIAPAVKPVLKMSLQANNYGYRRSELQSAFTSNKLGFTLSGYYAMKRNGFLEYTDFDKGSLTARIDYRFSQKTSLSNSFSYVHYQSDMAGSIDSTMFASRSFTNLQTFTFRNVSSARWRSTLSHQWNERSRTTASLVLRDNIISQNPSYRIKDDYRPYGGIWSGKKDLAHGEINKSRFNSLVFTGQHHQKLSWKKASFTGGMSMDLSPSSYQSNYIRIKKDSVSRKYLSYQSTDSTLTDYTTGINNYAAFLAFECNLLPSLRWVASLRYDLFRYSFNNHLQPSAFSGARDTLTNFSRFSPKIGITWNLKTNKGLYANYSQGFVPPQVTEMFTGVSVPDLAPSVFHNYEAGGWASFFNGRLSMDLSLYLLKGTNEIISVKKEDGSYENRNAGKTMHKGIEAGLQLKPVNNLSIRFSGAYSTHYFIEFEEKGTRYNGNEMNGAPRWMHNAEVWYRPSWFKGFRIGAEWQKIGSYYMDAKNSLKYEGYNLLNLRTAYQFRSCEIFIHVMNLADSYFSYSSGKSSFGHSYQLAEPRSIQAGVVVDFTSSQKQ